MENTRTFIPTTSYRDPRLLTRRRLGTVPALRRNRSIVHVREELDGFRPVTRADMPAIWQILSNETGRTTDFSYGGLLMWVNYFNYEFTIYKNTLFIRGLVENHRETPAFSLPIGELPLSESIALIRDYCRRKGIPCELSAVPEYAMGELMLLGPKATEELTDWQDYLYEAEPLATLKGKKMAKKRNHVNKFNSLYPDWELVKMTPANAMEAMDFMDLFDLEGDDTQMAISERHLTRELIGHLRAGDRELKGALLKVGGQTVAFTIGDIKGDTLFIHVEKATRRIEGSYEKINQTFAEKMMAEYPQIRFINREDDAGDEGLRNAKESYHPVDLLKKYNVIFD